MAPLPHQSPLISDPAWRSSPLNSARHTLPRPYYASPFRKVHVVHAAPSSLPNAGQQPTLLGRAARIFDPLDAFLARHPSLLLAVRFACLLSILALLALTLWDAHRGRRRPRDLRRLLLEEGAAADGADLKRHGVERRGSALVTRGLKPGSAFVVPAEPAFLVPEGFDFLIPRAGGFLVPVKEGVTMA